MTAISDISALLKSETRRLGFDLVGIAPAVTPVGIHEFLKWLDCGYAGEMDYLVRREPAYHHPRHVLDGVRSVVMLGLNYNTTPRDQLQDPGRVIPEHHEGVPARIARYAHGNADYHDVLRDKLDRLAEFLKGQEPGAQTRGIVDTAPLLERDFARLAGLGWFGKNTMLINKGIGSWFFIAALLTDVELEPDVPHEASHCGTCTRCLDACPTDAFPEPYVLDARKCISYLTIEHRGPIPVELREGIGDWLFGCDICQEVCPWNHKAPVSTEPAFQPQPDLTPADALEIASLTEDQFRTRFRHTPLSRPKYAGLRRNTVIALGNSHDPRAVRALESLLSDPDPTISDSATWALEQLALSEQRVRAPLDSVVAP